jgi:hypothetical protein
MAGLHKAGPMARWPGDPAISQRDVIPDNKITIQIMKFHQVNNFFIFNRAMLR